MGNSPNMLMRYTILVLVVHLALMAGSARGEESACDGELRPDTLRKELAYKERGGASGDRGSPRCEGMVMALQSDNKRNSIELVGIYLGRHDFAINEASRIRIVALDETWAPFRVRAVHADEQYRMDGLLSGSAFEWPCHILREIKVSRLDRVFVRAETGRTDERPFDAVYLPVGLEVLLEDDSTQRDTDPAAYSFWLRANHQSERIEYTLHHVKEDGDRVTVGASSVTLRERARPGEPFRFEVNRSILQPDTKYRLGVTFDTPGKRGAIRERHEKSWYFRTPSRTRHRAPAK